MRELKFRYFDAFDNRNEMIYFNLGKLSGGAVYPDLEKTMQYTGLKDKNSVEVYEGDILKVKDPDTGNVQVGSIQWFDHFACFNITNMSEDLREDILYIREIEVIGNIYENPKLLKGEAE